MVFRDHSLCVTGAHCYWAGLCVQPFQGTELETKFLKDKMHHGLIMILPTHIQEPFTSLSLASVSLLSHGKNPGSQLHQYNNLLA